MLMNMMMMVSLARAWNKLPPAITTLMSLAAFQHEFKMFLFRSARVFSGQIHQLTNSVMNYKALTPSGDHSTALERALL